MIRRQALSRVIATAAIAVLSLATSFAADPFDSKSAFEALTKLEGQWEATSHEGPLEVVYRVTGAGSAVAETLFPGTPHEMITMYFLDGDKLRLTHYCAAGNQPRMVFQKSTTPGEMHFIFDGATNMKSARDTHMHELVIHIAGPDQVRAEWTLFKDGVKNDVTVIDMHRKS